MSLTCLVRSCKYNCNSECKCPDGATISDDMESGGYMPICTDYEEEEGGGEDG